MSAAGNYFAWQARLVTPYLGRRVLEIGCGIGNFTGALLDRDLVVAIDPDAACLARLTTRYPDRSNLQVIAADARDLTPVAHFQFDSAVCLNVLEHIEDDLGALRQIARVLTCSAVLILLVPAFPALFGPIDRNLGHCRRYRRAAVAQLAEEAGFRVRSLRFVNAAGFFGWWMNARVFKHQAQSPGQIALFDRWVVPVASCVEARVNPPFGQSLLAVLQVR